MLSRSSLVARILGRVSSLSTTCVGPRPPLAVAAQSRRIHASTPNRDLMEFFDHKDNWGKEKVRVGRSWKKDELRLKSNEDLHKLWFILLKERNMLLTMIHAYKQENIPFPNEERLDKVDESMENLEEVVQERNRAFYELEVGESGEEEREITINRIGLETGYVKKEYPMPVWKHPDFKKFLRYRCRTNYGRDVRQFLFKYRELMYNKNRSNILASFAKAANTLKRFPNTSKEALEEWFPEVRYEEVIRYSKTKGHHRNTNIDAPE